MSDHRTTSSTPLRLAVLISGGGTTLVNLQQKILHGEIPAEIVSVIANKTCSGIEKAEQLGLSVQKVLRSQFDSLESYSDALFQHFRDAKVDLVILGGFLARILVPSDFDNRVMNIHPALIPAFSGQGMYGHHVHTAVIERGCQVSGCTVHFCDSQYDHGPIILQRVVPVEFNDTPDTLAARVFEAECEVYPEAIRRFAAGRLKIEGKRVTTLPSLTK